MAFRKRWITIVLTSSVLLIGCSDEDPDHGGGPRCGDGRVAATERCDDGNTEAGDGCGATCLVEPGYRCDGAPSACTPGCGDGLVMCEEACDDGNTEAGDGCDITCHVEAGYHCRGAPSACTSTCGDGATAADEGCDDGNDIDGDGCDASCTPTACGNGIETTGEVCDDGNLLDSDGCDANCTPTGCGNGVVTKGEPCDDGNATDGDGCDANCTPTACGNGIVTSGECCDDGNAADGDGCTQGCTIEAGFECSGVRSLCCLPEVETNDDAATSNPLPTNAFACGSIAPTGDRDYYSFTMPVAGDVVIATYDPRGNGYCDHTIDTVIYLYGSDGATELAFDNDDFISWCSKIEPATHPGARGLPPGTYHVAVERRLNNDEIPAYTLLIDPSLCGDGLVEGSEACDAGPAGSPTCSTSCAAITPGPGESRATAEPFPGCPAAPTSTTRLGTPSCFPKDGPVHWYSHVATDQVLAVSANAAGAIALVDDMGQELRCATDTRTIPVSTFSEAGETIHVAVSMQSSITCLEFMDHAYDGLTGTLTDLNITWPPSSGQTAESGMAASPTTIYIGASTRVFELPKTGDATAIVHGTADGLDGQHVGPDILLHDGSLFSLDSAPSGNRLYRIFDGSTWGPAVWDTSPAYPPSSSARSMTSDGTSLLTVTGGTEATPVSIYAYSLSAPAQAQLIGAVPVDHLVQASGIAADSQYLYIAGGGPRGPGVREGRRGCTASIGRTSRRLPPRLPGSRSPPACTCPWSSTASPTPASSMPGMVKATFTSS
ncbi:uncharacterized protein SOCE26_031410 [Sorangium cellulosum]|uniref:Multiple EGF-like-domain protein 3 n=1 Tax=Sorangium cellulosum TaxID=56 RepID=A0A2L0EQZ2_SORCE|nr:DUF4215 domain-containing protein [Sorangium cellulosum]AUX41719.1 uncharacterized protein SOCE26_031410 [Sorangium cellulosum]